MREASEAMCDPRLESIGTKSGLETRTSHMHSFASVGFCLRLFIGNLIVFDSQALEVQLACNTICIN